MVIPKQEICPEHASADLSPATPESAHAAVYLCLGGIPRGRVTSYGQLAASAGLGRGARQVARILARLPEGSCLPWHRVLCASGRFGLPDDCPAGQEQRRRLREEGIQLDNDRVDLRRYGWRPDLPNG